MCRLRCPRAPSAATVPWCSTYVMGSCRRRQGATAWLLTASSAPTRRRRSPSTSPHSAPSISAASPSVSLRSRSASKRSWTAPSHAPMRSLRRRSSPGAPRSSDLARVKIVRADDADSSCERSPCLYRRWWSTQEARMAVKTGTVIVGGGQAGLSLSAYLTSRNHPHVVLERGRVGERWSSERWDSLHMLTTNTLNQIDVATGDCGVPYRPPAASTAPPELAQLDAAQYRTPEQLAAGSVLVVGA